MHCERIDKLRANVIGQSTTQQESQQAPSSSTETSEPTITDLPEGFQYKRTDGVRISMQAMDNFSNMSLEHQVELALNPCEYGILGLNENIENFTFTPALCERYIGAITKRYRSVQRRLHSDKVKLLCKRIEAEKPELMQYIPVLQIAGTTATQVYNTLKTYCLSQAFKVERDVRNAATSRSSINPPNVQNQGFAVPQPDRYDPNDQTLHPEYGHQATYDAFGRLERRRQRQPARHSAYGSVPDWRVRDPPFTTGLVPPGYGNRGNPWTSFGVRRNHAYTHVGPR